MIGILFIVFSVVAGLGIGSFLNAVIFRLHTGESPLKGRSHCMNCGKTLSWYELVPVFSYIIQRGKCRECGTRLSPQYPLVEIATAGIFLLIVINSQLLSFNEFSVAQFLNIAFLFLISSGLIVIFVYDLKHYIIPDRILFPLIGIVFLAHLLNILNFEFWSLGLVSDFAFRYLDFHSLINAVLLGILSAIPFAAIHFISKGRAMGFGDVKFAFFMGVLLGYPAVLSAMFIAFVLGAIIGIVLMLAGKKSMQSKVPFGPFLIVGTFLSLFWGGELISFYLNLFL